MLKVDKLQYALEDTFYMNVDPRRRQEVRDSKMLSEDHRAMANLPTYGIHAEYNQNYFKYNQNRSGYPWQNGEIG